jgi:hypothetical protein
MKVMGQGNPGRLIRLWYESRTKSVQVYLFHGTNSIHLINLGSETLDLDTDVCALLDDLLSVVSPLRWRGIRVKGDV